MFVTPEKFTILNLNHTDAELHELTDTANKGQRQMMLRITSFSTDFMHTPSDGSNESSKERTKELGFAIA